MKFTLLLLAILIPSGVFCQDEFLILVNKKLDQNEKIIRALKAKNRKLTDQLKVIVNREKLNSAALNKNKKKLQKLQNKLNDKNVQITSLLEEIQKLKTHNKELEEYSTVLKDQLNTVDSLQAINKVAIYITEVSGVNTDSIVVWRNNGAKDWKFQMEKLAESTPHYDIWIKNICNQELYVILHFCDLAGNWVTRGHYNVHPNESIKLDVQTAKNHFYTYAYSIDGKITWSGIGQQEVNKLSLLISSQSFTRLSEQDHLEGLPHVKQVLFIKHEAETLVKHEIIFTCY